MPSIDARWPCRGANLGHGDRSSASDPSEIALDVPPRFEILGNALMDDQTTKNRLSAIDQVLTREDASDGLKPLLRMAAEKYALCV